VLVSISPETAGGPSGIDGAFINITRHNAEFVDLILYITKQIAKGEMELRKLFVSSSIVPLLKNKLGDVRPIAVGEVFYRIAGRIIAKEAKTKLLNFQFGVYSPGGVEPLVHLCELRGNTHTIISIDLKNAYNSMKRSFIREALAERSPDLLPTFYWSYGRYSDLFLSNGLKLESRRGIKQGDPLGPILFSVGYSRILSAIKDKLEDLGMEDELNLLAYLDDTYMIVRNDDVERTLRIIREVFEEFKDRSGLELNLNKSWTISPKEFRTDGISLLGSHIGAKKEEFLDQKMEELENNFRRLHEISSQDAMIILRKCYIPKMTHLLRTLEVPIEALERTDEVVARFLQRYTQRLGEMHGGDYRLVTLPPRLGGLGLTSFATIAEECLEASREASFRILTKIKPTLISPTLTEKAKSQKERVGEIWKTLSSEFIKEASPERRRAYAENCSVIGTRWLHALPIDAATTFNNATFEAAIADRLLFSPMRCRQCERIDNETRHGLNCKGNSRLWLPRHELMKKIIGSAFQEGGCEVRVEPGDAKTHKRADLLINGELTEGKAAYDVSVMSVTGTAAAAAVAKKQLIIVPDSTDDVMIKARKEIQLVLADRFTDKLRRNAGRDYGGIFKPFVFSAGGILHHQAMDEVKRMKIIVPKIYLSLMYQLSCSLAKFRARSFLRCNLPP